MGKQIGRGSLLLERVSSQKISEDKIHNYIISKNGAKHEYDKTTDWIGYQ